MKYTVNQSLLWIEEKSGIIQNLSSVRNVEIRDDIDEPGLLIRPGEKFLFNIETFQSIYLLTDEGTAEVRIIKAAYIPRFNVGVTATLGGASNPVFAKEQSSILI